MRAPTTWRGRCCRQAEEVKWQQEAAKRGTARKGAVKVNSIIQMNIFINLMIQENGADDESNLIDIEQFPCNKSKFAT